jgi:hypothetical protein
VTDSTARRPAAGHVRLDAGLIGAKNLAGLARAVEARDPAAFADARDACRKAVQPGTGQNITSETELAVEAIPA